MSDLKIIGISTETSNQNGKSIEDLGKLWGRFFEKNIFEKIPNKVSGDIYAIYTDYESDYTGKYTTIIGVKVSSLEEIPSEMIGRSFKDQTFKQFLAKGIMPNAIAETWKQIWEKDKELNRTYSYDYELYGAKSQNGADAEVEIFIGIKA